MATARCLSRISDRRRAFVISGKTLYFVRHGQTEWNAIARMQGRANSHLDETGRLQAEGHGRLLATLDIDALYASPLDRARETTAIVRRYIDLEATFDDRIMEWDCGDWSGNLRSEVARRWPEQWAALAADPYHYRGPGCENYPDMIARARPFVDELLASAARSIAVISHGMIGRVMVGIAMGFNAEQMLSYRQPNDVIYCVHLPEPVRAGSPRLRHYVAASGPFDGAVPHS